MLLIRLLRRLSLRLALTAASLALGAAVLGAIRPPGAGTAPLPSLDPGAILQAARDAPGAPPPPRPAPGGRPDPGGVLAILEQQKAGLTGGAGAPGAGEGGVAGESGVAGPLGVGAALGALFGGAEGAGGWSAPSSGRWRSVAPQTGEDAAPGPVRPPRAFRASPAPSAATRGGEGADGDAR